MKAMGTMKHEKIKKPLTGDLNPLSAKLTKWPNTLKQFVGNLPTNCLSVFGHFVGLALKGLRFEILRSKSGGWY